MKISIKWFLGLLSVSLTTATSASAFTWNCGPVRQEASAGAVFFQPKDNNSLFNNGYGGELQYRFWFTDDWALALAAGYTRLNVAQNETEIAPGTDGTVDTFPLGGDIVFNLFDIQPVRLNVLAGARYILTSSDASCLNVAGKRVDMDVDNGSIWHVGLDGDCSITKQWALFGAASYQQDISKQHISTADGLLRDNTFRGFTFEIGLRAHF